MDKQLTDKIALVTGAAHPRGIGRSIVNALTDAGATVFGVDLPNVEGLADIGGLSCDVTQPDTIKDLIDRIIDQHGRLDIVVNNAGVGRGSADFMAISDEDWDITLAVNLRGIVNVCREAIPHLSNSQGNVINIASAAGLGAVSGIPACYSASKFAVVGLTKQLALQYASQGIRFNAICPGSVETQMLDVAMEIVAEAENISASEARQLESTIIPIGRSAQPEEIAQAAVYLASDMATYVTGVALPVAGGFASGL
jgi:3-oxoacyl-[acyl-carrier protein] reductase